MSKFYLFLATALAIAPVTEAKFQRPVHLQKKQHDRIAVAKTQSFSETAIRRAQAASMNKWVPGKVTISIPDGDGGWEPESEHTFTYNNQGLIEKQVTKALYEDNVQVSTLEYDANGKVTLELVKAGENINELENSSKTIKAYDSRIPNLVIASELYSWEQSDWTLNARSYIREVTRDDAGNVTKVVYKTMYNGFYEAVQRVEITYGNDGKASTITEYQLSYDNDYNEIWEEGFSLKECQWECTDGQLFSLDYVFEGNNKIKSCIQYSEGELVGNMAVTYNSANEDFTATTTILEEGTTSTATQVWNDLPNGGFQSTVTYTMEEDGATIELMKEIEREDYDIFGNVIFACVVDYYDGEVEIYDWQKADSEINADGCPTTVILRNFIQDTGDDDDWGDWGDWESVAAASRKTPAEDFDTETPPAEGEWEDYLKMDHSDFQQLSISSVGNISVPNTDAPVEYFTLDGRRVAQPKSGIYIRRQGSSVTKTAIQ